MGIRKYIFFSMVLTALCGLYVYTFQDGSFMIEFFGVPITLKIALWVIVPMAILAFFSILHLLYYNMKVYVANRALIKDYETYKSSCKAAILNENIKANYKTEWFKLSSQMLSLLKSHEEGAKTIVDEDLKKICDDLSRVKKGEFVELKTYKLSRENPIYIQNKINELKQNPKIASDILRTYGNKLDMPLTKLAYDALIKNGSYAEIQKTGIELKGEDVIALVKRKLDKEDKIFIDDVAINDMVENTNLHEDEYLKIAQLLKRDMNPDTLVAMFERVFTEKSKASKAYIYILFELQMIDKAREVLENSEEHEYEAFKTLLFLRDNGKNTDIKYFI